MQGAAWAVPALPDALAIVHASQAGQRPGGKGAARDSRAQNGAACESLGREIFQSPNASADLEGPEELRLFVGLCRH